MKLKDLESRLHQIAWPPPSEGLRARIVWEAPIVAGSIAWSDRVWFSRAWRLSMAAAILALLTVDHLAGSRAAPPRSDPADGRC